MDGELNPKLAAYLAAPPEVQAAFDEKIAAAAYAETEAERQIHNLLDGDPVYEQVRRKRRARRSFEAWLTGLDR